jgi:RHH-type rel operon transcriptional repressor/antitoxin RelB
MVVRDVPRSVRIPADVDERLDRLAESTGRSKSFYLRELVTQGLDDLEYAYGIAARAEAIRTGIRPTRPLADVMTEMGITQTELDVAPSETE